MKKLPQGATVLTSLVFASSILVSMAAISAFAADAPVATPPSSSIYNWSGFYVGSIAGPA